MFCDGVVGVEVNYKVTPDDNVFFGKRGIADGRTRETDYGRCIDHNIGE